jgi:hypothetical protein
MSKQVINMPTSAAGLWNAHRTCRVRRGHEDEAIVHVTIEDLAKAVRERKAILFVGAGISRSVDLPSSEKLIDHMAAELGLDEQRA